jgi:hypothetical protein
MSGTTPAAAPADDEREVRPFAAFLRNLGSVHEDATTGLNELVVACRETGKKGTLTIKIEVAPQKDEVTMLVTGDVVAKPPRHTSKPSLFFPDEHGNLLRNDPRQLDIANLREVPGGKAADGDAAPGLREAR